MVERAEAKISLELPPEKRASLLASPRAVMVLIPLLVLAVGIALTVVGQTSLHRVSAKMASERFHQQTLLAAQGLGAALGQADSVLDTLAAVIPELPPLPEAPSQDDLAPLSRELLDLSTGRPGVVQIYLAFADGRFLAAHPSFVDAQLELYSNGVRTAYQLGGKTLHRVSESLSAFDPRERDWFRLAVSTKGRAWSEPYAFYQSQQLGVTRVRPIYRRTAPYDLLAVAGVDFDVTTLTKFMAESETTDMHSVVFTPEGVVLAYPKGVEKIRTLPRTPSVPTYQALADPTLNGLFARLRALPSEHALRRLGSNGRGGHLLTFKAGDARMLASVRRLPQGGPPWMVASVARRDTALGALREYRRSSLIIGGLAVALAMLVGWFLARYIVRARRDAVLARAAARAAQKQARDLGSYRLVNRLGEGGMGEVWRARHHLLAREAAIKLIRTEPGIASDKKRELEERFRREARAIAALRSRNTIELFDYGLTADGTLYYVMELLEGIDLQSLVEQFGPQPPERVRQILIQTCNSLGEAHDVSLVHRDIKPANLFLCRAANEVDVVKVLDFGLVLSPLEASRKLNVEERAEQLSRLQSAEASQDLDLSARLTQADMQLGTPGFMAPEQAIGGETDSRADLYSLGCVAWWLLTGTPLFEAETAIGVMLKHIQAPVPPLRERTPFELSTGLESIILSCLEKTCDRRPQSARQLLEDLRELPKEADGWDAKVAERWWNAHIPSAPPLPAQVSVAPGPAPEVLSPLAG